LAEHLHTNSSTALEKSFLQMAPPSWRISTNFASWLRYCSDVAHRRPTKLCTIFGRLLAGTLYIHFWGLLPLTEFCHVQNSLYVQVLRSRILAPLLHGTPAASLSQTFAAWYKEWNCGTFADGTVCIRLGVRHVGHRPTLWSFIIQCVMDICLLSFL